MSNINANNITTTNITTSTLNVTTINGVPIANLIGGYYPCTSCSAEGCDPDVGCGECSGCADFVPDACDCYIAPSTGVPTNASFWADYLYWNTSAWVVGDQNITLGRNAGQTSQGTNAVALGFYAGNYFQGTNSIAIGYQTAQTNQASGAISIGYQAGQGTQGINSIAIGVNSGLTNQGSGAIAIGTNAGQTNQPANSIVINAEPVTSLSGVTQSSFYVAPIRAATQTTALGYDITNKEITYYSVMSSFSATFSSPTLSAVFPTTATFATATVTGFTGTISAFTFNGGVTNGQYVIIIPASGGAITITPLTTALQSTRYFNFSASVSVTSGKYAVMTVVFDGTRYYVSCSAFNSN